MSDHYYQKNGVTLYHGDCLEVMRSLPDGSVDAVVTDPPYGLSFMGKKWDYDIPSVDVWRECLRVLKPAGYLLSFAGSRTHHRMACTIEDAGFEIRDCILWLYGTGFPKGQGNLKPAYEPITLARKRGPKVLPLGIDGCRVPCEVGEKLGGGMLNGTSKVSDGWDRPWRTCKDTIEKNKRIHADRVAKAESLGRYPANVLHDGSEEVLEAFAEFGERGGGFGTENRSNGTGIYGAFSGSTKGRIVGLGDSGTAARFYYTAKASRSERWKMLKCDCQTLIIPSWEKQGQSQSVQTVATSHKRDTFADDSTGECDSSISSPGSKPTGRFLPDSKSTTSTKTNKTIESTTCGSSAQQNTSDCTEDVNLETGYGGSPASSAANTSKSIPITGTSPSRGGHCTVGVGSVTSQGSSKRSVCEKCGEPFVETSHPTVKPLSLVRWLVRLACPSGGIVLDPFVGSGTTGLACLHEERNCVLVEREQAYCDIAVRRLSEVPSTTPNS